MDGLRQWYFPKCGAKAVSGERVFVVTRDEYRLYVSSFSMEPAPPPRLYCYEQAP